jgi:hypothetical protein
MGMLKEIEVAIGDLLLDPNNPRFISDFSEFEPVADDHIADAQSDTLSLFSRTPADDPDFDVTNIADLYDSMRRIGYVGIDRIVVRPLHGTNRFLVLEGNRRVATVKSLKRDYETKNPPLDKPRARAEYEEHKPSFDKIRTMLLDTVGLSDAEINHKVAIILGIRHHGSLLAWAPLPSAFNIYTEYMSEEPRKETFEFLNPKASAVANRLCIQTSDVTSALRTYVAYLELRERFPLVRDEHFSLIEYGIKDKRLKRGYFTIDEDTFEPSEQSLTKLNALCQFATRDSGNSEVTKNGKRKILQKPQDFTSLGRLVDRMHRAKHTAIKAYADELIRRVEDEDDQEMTIDQAVNDLTAFENRTKWADAVGRLLDKQEKDLSIDKYAGEGSDRGHKDDLKKTLEPLRRIMGI